MVQQATILEFGAGNVGADRHLQGEQKQQFEQGLAACTHEIPSGPLAIDCMDDRKTLRLADGTVDLAVLRARAAGQLAGGRTLATLKAALAADAAFLKDVKTMQQGYELIDGMFKQFVDANGQPLFLSGAHIGCGASGSVEKSVAEPVEHETLVDTFVNLGAGRDAVAPALGVLAQNKFRRLESGLYGTWDPAWHVAFEQNHHPEGLAELEVADDDVHGHYAAGVYAVKDGAYFAKNAFIEDTGLYAFGLTFGVADRIADLFGGNAQERTLMKLAFKEDAFNVTNHIVAAGMEVYA